MVADSCKRKRSILRLVTRGQKWIKTKKRLSSVLLAVKVQGITRAEEDFKLASFVEKQSRDRRDCPSP